MRDGEPLRGLRPDQFTVREDGEIQTISTFAEGEFPLSAAVGVDRSWSMAGERLAVAKAGARTLLAELRPEDQAMVVAIGGVVETVAPLSVRSCRAGGRGGSRSTPGARLPCMMR